MNRARPGGRRGFRHGALPLGLLLAGCAAGPCGQARPDAAVVARQEPAVRARLGTLDALLRLPYSAQLGLDLDRAWRALGAGLPAEADQVLRYDLCAARRAGSYNPDTWARFADAYLDRPAAGTPAAADETAFVTFDPATPTGQGLVTQLGAGNALLGELRNCAGRPEFEVEEEAARVEAWARETEELLRRASEPAARRFRSGVAVNASYDPGCSQLATDVRNKLILLLDNLRPMIR